MVGARIDQTILVKLLGERLPKLCAHFEDCYYDPSL